MENIETILKEFSNKFNQEIEAYFVCDDVLENRAIKAMKYSLLNGGKRLRPFLLCECASIFEVDFNTVLPIALSLEMIHTYSLIHDDLPAMDNDDLRRGKPTCHKAFDEATAILAGDGLLTYAFELLNKSKICDKKKVELSVLLAKMAGAFNGMIKGQVLDLYSVAGDDMLSNEEIIKKTQSLKTGCLLRFPCVAGAILGDAKQNQIDVLVKYAKNLGLAFQITDDILDVVGDVKLLGKTLNKDKEQNKLNFVSLYGIDKSKEIATNLIKEAVEGLSCFGKKADNLKKLAEYLLVRKN